MKKTENSDLKVAKIVEADVPLILHEKFQELNSIKQEIALIRRNAEETQNSAQKAKQEKAGLFNKQRVITNVQDVVASLADNQVETAEINNRILIYQQKQTETMKFLLGLGVSNLANNRAVIKFLKQKLDDGVGKDFSEIEEEEILSIIKQLKAQEDILERQNQISDKVKKHDREIVKQQDKDIEHDERIGNVRKELVIIKKRNAVLSYAILVAIAISLAAVVMAVIGLLN